VKELTTHLPNRVTCGGHAQGITKFFLRNSANRNAGISHSPSACIPNLFEIRKQYVEQSSQRNQVHSPDLVRPYASRWNRVSQRAQRPHNANQLRSFRVSNEVHAVKACVCPGEYFPVEATEHLPCGHFIHRNLLTKRVVVDVYFESTKSTYRTGDFARQVDQKELALSLRNARTFIVCSVRRPLRFLSNFVGRLAQRIGSKTQQHDGASAGQSYQDSCPISPASPVHCERTYLDCHTPSLMERILP